MNANIRHAVLASLAGDALAMAPHWIYDTSVLVKRFNRVDNLLDAPEGGYHYPKKAGEFTHYGDQSVTLLKSLAECGGLNLEDFCKRWKRLFGSYGGYIDNATRGTLVNLASGWGPEDSGSLSTDLAGASRLAPLLALLPGLLAESSPAEAEDALAQLARRQTAMTHKGRGVPEAAEFFVRVTMRVLDGADPVETMLQVSQMPWDAPFSQWTRQGVDSAEKDTFSAIAGFGQSCHLDGGFPGVIHLVAKYRQQPAEALVQSIMAGGDGAARNMAAGMLLGAYAGENAYDSQWVTGLRQIDDINLMLDKFLQ